MHCVENMFSVRTKPWHGLGVILDNPPSIAEGIVAAGLDWTVDANPVFDANGNQIPGYVANVRSSDKSVLGIVTNKYSVVQNIEAFEFVDGLIGEGMTLETAGSLRDGKQVWVLGKMPETKILDDAFEPYVCFTNSHDGTSSIRACMTPTRVVCMNTLNLALSSAQRSWSTRHIGDIQGKLIEAQHSLGLISAYMSELDTEANRLAEIKVTDEAVEAMLDILYPVKDDDSDIRKRRVSNLKSNFFNCLAAPDIKQYKGTAYAVINAATDYADHGAPFRATAKFEENRWGQIIVGHPFVDAIYKQIVA